MENKLKLEHIAPYIPYGLKIKTPKGLHTLKGIDTVFDAIGLSYWLDGKKEVSFSIDCKPILRPLSDLTKDIEHNCERFVPKEVLIDRYDLKFDENDDFFLDYYCIGETDSPWTGYHIIQLLIQWHFDVFGLIEKGLAVDINTIENA